MKNCFIFFQILDYLNDPLYSICIIKIIVKNEKTFVEPSYFLPLQMFFSFSSEYNTSSGEMKSP